MGKLNTHIANANDKFTSGEVSAIENAIVSAEKFINKHFDFDYDVDIVITAPSFLMSTIPEDGISGRTYNSELVVLALDKQERPINEDIVFETVCHEMSHSLRWEKLPEYSKTLFDGMILEGLAIVLEEEAVDERRSHEKQFFLAEIQNTSQGDIDGMIAHLKDDFDNERYDYNAIFYTGNDALPRWSGYKLGYYYVKKYLRQKNSTIFDVTLASYSEFNPEI